MAITLSSLALAMGEVNTVIAGVESTISVSKKLYEAVSEIIEDVETAYKDQTGAGSTKKAAVLAAAKVLADALGEDWSTISSMVSAWIDSVISTYNTIKSFFSDLFSSDDSDDSDSTADDSAADSDSAASDTEAATAADEATVADASTAAAATDTTAATAA